MNEEKTTALSGTPQDALQVAFASWVLSTTMLDVLKARGMPQEAFDVLVTNCLGTLSVNGFDRGTLAAHLIEQLHERYRQPQPREKA